MAGEISGIALSLWQKEFPSIKSIEDAREMANTRMGKEFITTKTSEDGMVSADFSDDSLDKKSNEEIALEVIRGRWGNGADRKTKLAEAGYDYSAVQSIVNSKLGVTSKSASTGAATGANSTSPAGDSGSAAPVNAGGAVTNPNDRNAGKDISSNEKKSDYESYGSVTYNLIKYTDGSYTKEFLGKDDNITGTNCYDSKGRTISTVSSSGETSFDWSTGENGSGTMTCTSKDKINNKITTTTYNVKNHSDFSGGLTSLNEYELNANGSSGRLLMQVDKDGNKYKWDYSNLDANGDGLIKYTTVINGIEKVEYQKATGGVGTADFISAEYAEKTGDELYSKTKDAIDQMDSKKAKKALTAELDTIQKAINNKTMNGEEISKAFQDLNNKVKAYYDKVASLEKEQNNSDPEIAKWYKDNGYDLVKLYKDNYNNTADGIISAIKNFKSTQVEYQKLFGGSFDASKNSSDPKELQNIKGRIRTYADSTKSPQGLGAVGLENITKVMQSIMADYKSYQDSSWNKSLV